MADKKQPEQTGTETTADTSPEAQELLQGSQEAMDAEQEQGYRGTVPDPTPNEAYTLQGVGRGDPTPETDEGLAEEARRSSRLR